MKLPNAFYHLILSCLEIKRPQSLRTEAHEKCKLKKAFDMSISKYEKFLEFNHKIKFTYENHRLLDVNVLQKPSSVMKNKSDTYCLRNNVVSLKFCT